MSARTSRQGGFIFLLLARRDVVLLYAYIGFLLYSGINNSCGGSKKAQNVKSARFCVDGEARVILYAGRNIAAGERLMYDYNALQKDGYPTEHFD